MKFPIEVTIELQLYIDKYQLKKPYVKTTKLEKVKTWQKTLKYQLLIIPTNALCFYLSSAQ